ncbi:hypothetical protein HYFRA_00011271 [Hymenoscyphus fraxineus]|uniref:Uncharacterized protein n=1 Tax=Hymenoscyphus fraxineus TaxID=746836 RepID=A0A9N9KWR2_9HELO|nr:hypothetical protein HYFRA_00011271 [Hymenoscyphus fraxineus]
MTDRWLLVGQGHEYWGTVSKHMERSAGENVLVSTIDDTIPNTPHPYPPLPPLTVDALGPPRFVAQWKTRSVNKPVRTQDCISTGFAVTGVIPTLDQRHNPRMKMLGAAVSLTAVDGGLMHRRLGSRRASDDLGIRSLPGIWLDVARLKGKAVKGRGSLLPGVPTLLRSRFATFHDDDP